MTGKAVTLTAGAKDIYVVVEDAAENISDVLKIVAAAFIGGGETDEGTEGLEYELKNGSYTVTDYKGESDTVVIPSSYNGKPVTSIGYCAFEGCSSLTEITIPNSVTSIDMYAFANCSSLTSITIPNSVTSIGPVAFEGCSSLESITIPSSVTNIGPQVFSGCSSLESITIPDSVTSIGNFAFEDTGIWNATPVNEIVYADKWVVGYKGNITGKSITNGTVGISSGAFLDYTDLTSITIPSSVTSINGGAFNNCTGLTSINVDNNNPKYTSVNGILYNKEKTKIEMIPPGINGSITIPEGITSIGDDAFVGCTGITEITLPNSVTSIGNYVFLWCTGLTSITIPNSVTSIGDGAFNGCSSLESIAMPNSITSIGNYVFYYCEGLSSITIPESVTSIGNYAFYSCSSLTEITIPNSVTSIGSYAFRSTGLVSVTFEGTITSEKFSSDDVFRGDLRDKYLATGGAGGIGTYTREADSDTWTKQN